MSRKLSSQSQPVMSSPNAILCSMELLKTEQKLKAISDELMTLGVHDAELGMDLLACIVSLKYVRSYLDEETA